MKPRRPVTTLIMMAPIFTLYFGSIWAALIFEKR
jgi:Sec-independent protein secretion pathway component TatC